MGNVLKQKIMLRIKSRTQGRAKSRTKSKVKHGISLTGKNVFGFMVVAVFGMMGCIFSSVQMDHMAQYEKIVEAKDLPAYERIYEMSENAQQMIADLQIYSATKDKTYLNKYTTQAASIDTTLLLLKLTAAGEKEKEQSKEAQEVYDAYTGEVNKKLLPAWNQNQDTTALMQELTMLSQKVTEKFSEYKIAPKEKITEDLYQFTEIESKTKTDLLFLIVIQLSVSLVFSLILSVILTKPIKLMQKRLEKAAAENDLTVEFSIRNRDEIGRMAEAWNNFMQQIRNSFISVREASEGVELSVGTTVGYLENLNGGMKDISITTEGLSNGMEESSHSIQEVSTAVKEISDTVQSIVIRTQDGAVKADQIHERAESKKSEVKEKQKNGLTVFEEIKSKLESAMENAKEVEKINLLAKNIFEITDQTNLLSLNASIEAARAGESGRGFSVVASEIGKLAQNSAMVVSQIQDVNEVVRKSVNSLVLNANDLLEYMSNTVHRDYAEILITTETYEQDADSIREITEDLSSATEELSATLENITFSITTINERVKERASGTENIAKKTEEAARQSSRIFNEIEYVKANVNGLADAIHLFKY